MSSTYAPVLPARILNGALPVHWLTPQRSIVLAQSALETGWWSRMPGNNYGGVKATRAWRGATRLLETTEVMDGESVTLRQLFRSYQTLEEGASDFVKTLRISYPVAFARAEASDIRGYCSALKKAYYFTAAERDYYLALYSIAHRIRKSLDDNTDAWYSNA